MEGTAEPASQSFVHEKPGHDQLSNQGIEALKDIAFGSLAGIVGKYVEYPFDTVKVRLQSQPDQLPLRYTGPLDCFQQSIKRDGFLSLYRGISAPLVGAAIETSSLFFGYRIAQDAFRTFVYRDVDQLSMSALVICGAGSGAFTSLWLTPIELVKCQMQVPLGDGTRRPSATSIIASVFRRQGFLGFWHGQLGMLIRETGGTAAWFGSYEGVSAFFRNARSSWASKDLAAPPPDLPVHQQMMAGAVAGMTYNFVFYPADTVKSRMQTEEAGQLTGGKRTFWAVAKALWQQRGLRGLYQGCGITVGRAAPSSALIFTVYEALRKAFD